MALKTTTKSTLIMTSGASPLIGFSDGSTSVYTTFGGSSVASVTGALPSTHAITASGAVPVVVVFAAS